jgi:hypothetical protein
VGAACLRYLVNPWDALSLASFWARTPPAVLPRITWTIVRPDYRQDYTQYPINKVKRSQTHTERERERSTQTELSARHENRLKARLAGRQGMYVG